MVKHNFLNLKSTYTPAEIMEEMRNLYGIRMNNKKAYRAKEKAHELVRGSLHESYAKLPAYLYMVKTINPGSFTRLHKMEDNHFLYVFVALSTSIRGWRYCMPTIVVDGTFLKSAYKGTVLSASVLDAAGHILLLAYAVVDSENDTSWEWFFRMFNTTFGEREGMCIVSDRHDNILKAAALNNIKGRFKKSKKQLKGLFFTMARTYIKADFNRLMEDINKVDNRVKEYLFDIGYEKWSIAHAHVNRLMFMTSNIAESLNSANRDARDLPIKKFLQFMMDLVIRWNNEHRQHSEATFTELGNKYNIIMRENLILSNKMKVMGSTHYSYVVIDETGKETLFACVKKKSSCLQFQVYGILCPYAMAVLTYTHMDLQSYCAPYYTREKFLKVYELPVIPRPDETTWHIPIEISTNIVLPPIWKPKPGRPKKNNRGKGIMDYFKQQISCGRYEKIGHNRRTWENAPTRI
ncbi:uncharacterized protein LOC107876944 [Capsicum annuum]|uniref:uncharacterized protein LOC107876944 n=1 Tax=Capsicum annuum TaxID=4072 RepID=UPI001FB18C48|nr:uncharacterized protein LOC107876944 [Capsicum annuum]